MLQIFKLVAGFLGPAQKPNERKLGYGNEDARYDKLNSIVRNKPAESDCYWFTEVRDIGNGRLLVPDDLWRDPPPLVKKMMEEGSGETQAPASTMGDDDLLAAMTRLSPVKEISAAAAKKVSAKRVKKDGKKAKGKGLIEV